MAKSKSSLQIVGLCPYRGHMNAVETATAIQAARLNANDLLQTAKVLFEKELYPHSLAFSILSIEETGKQQILMSIFLEIDGLLDKHWNAYKRHTSKTEFFNFAIQSRTQVVFPSLDPKNINEIGTAGPTPEEMDAIKQLCFYSDCFTTPEGLSVHLPRNVDRKEQAKGALAEATLLVGYLRDYPPKELEVWKKHVSESVARTTFDRQKPLYKGLHTTQGPIYCVTSIHFSICATGSSLAKKQGLRFDEILKPLQDELLKEGFIKDGQWTSILKELGSGR